MGEPVDQPGWAELVGGWFRAQLARPNQFAAFVTEDAEIGVAACAIGMIDFHAPTTTNPSGQIGYIFNVSTDPRARRRGYARAAMEALLDWYDRHTEVGLIRLSTTSDGAGLYHQLGFSSPGWPGLVRHRPDSSVLDACV